MLNRILIVDDSRAMRTFVRAALEEAKLVTEVVEAESGFEALRILPRESFDLALIDINMPSVNGLELIRFMRGSKAHKNTPLVIISSEASVLNRERGLALGADSYLIKPFSPSTLVDALKPFLPAGGDG